MTISWLCFTCPLCVVSLFCKGVYFLVRVNLSLSGFICLYQVVSVIFQVVSTLFWLYVSLSGCICPCQVVSALVRLYLSLSGYICPCQVVSVLVRLYLSCHSAVTLSPPTPGFNSPPQAPGCWMEEGRTENTHFTLV